MQQLMYLSSASGVFSKDDLYNILEKSRKNNGLSNISGLLLYNNGSFLQILEGEETAVHILYLKIMKDPRHKGFVTIFDREVEQRDFAEWSMGFKNLTSVEWEQLSGFIDLNNKQKFLHGLELKRADVVTMIKTFFVVNAR